MPVSQWVMLDCLLASHNAYSTDSATEILSTSEICLRTEVQYLGNAAWYGVGVIGNLPSFMLYRLARSPLTQRDWKVYKDRFGLVRSANSAQAQSLLLCPALCPVMEGTTKKSGGGGTVKKNFRRCAPEFVPPPTFEMLPAPQVELETLTPQWKSDKYSPADSPGCDTRTKNKFKCGEIKMHI